VKLVMVAVTLNLSACNVLILFFSPDFIQTTLVELCTAGLPVCSLISTTLTVAHAYTMDPGVLQTELLDSSRDQLIESVVIQNDVETFYAGELVAMVEFLIALEGVPDGIPMNALQRRYFVRTTSTLLYSFSELPIYRVDVTDEVVSGGDTSEGRRRLTHGLRGTSTRRLQATGVSKVITTIHGGGSPSDLRSAILETFVINNERYRLELSREQLRPGEINELDSGAWFGDIFKVSASIKPSNFGGGGGGREDSGSANWFTPPAICLIALSIIWLAFRIYKDYVKDYMSGGPAPSKEEMENLENEGQGPETGSYESDPVMPPGSNHNRRPSLGGQGLPPGSNHSRASKGNRRPSWDGQGLPPGSNHSNGSKGSKGNMRPSWDGHPRPGSSHNRGPPGSTHSRGPPGSIPLRRYPSFEGSNRSNHGRGPNASSHSRGSPGSIPLRRNPSLEEPNRSTHGRGPPASNHSRGPPGSIPLLRNPSFEGPNRRHSTDGKFINSDHQPRRPTTQPSLDRLQAQSGHPRNRAGENGRGIQPSRSADYQPRPPGGTGSIGRPNPNSTHSRNMTSNHSRRPPPPRNLAGQNGRGIQSSKSMPTMKHPPSDLICDPSSSDSDSDEEGSSDDESTFASGDDQESDISDDESGLSSGEESSIAESDNEKTTPKDMAGSKRDVASSRSIPVQIKSTEETEKKDDSQSSNGISKKSIKKVAGKTADIKPKSQPAATKIDRHDPRLPILVSDSSESNDDSSYYSSGESGNEKGGVRNSKSLPAGRASPRNDIGKSNDFSEEGSIDFVNDIINFEDSTLNSEDSSIRTEASSSSSEESEASEPKKVTAEKRGVVTSKSMPVAKKSATVFKGIVKKKDLSGHGSSLSKNQAGEKKGIKDYSSSLSSLPKNQAGEKKGIKDHSSSLSTLPKNQAGKKKGIKDHGSSLPKTGEKRGIKDHGSSLSSLPKNQAGEKKGIKDYSSSLSKNQAGEKKGIKDHGSSLASLSKNQAGEKKGIKASKSIPVTKKKAVPPKTASDDCHIRTFNAPKKVQKQALDCVPKVQPPKVNGLKSPVKFKVADPANSEAEHEKIRSPSLKSKASIASKKPLPENARGRNGRGLTSRHSMPVTSKEVAPLKKLVFTSTSESDEEESSCSDESDSESSDSSPIHEKKAINRSGMAGRGVSGAMSMPVTKKAPPSKISAKYAEPPDDMSDFSSSLNSTATPNSKSRPMIKGANIMPVLKGTNTTTEDSSTNSQSQGTAKSQTPNKTNKVDTLAKYASGHKRSDDEHDRGKASLDLSEAILQRNHDGSGCDDDDAGRDAASPPALKPKTEPPKRVPPKISKSMPFQKRVPPKRTKSFESSGKIKFQPKMTASGGSGSSVPSKETMESPKTHSTHKSKQTHMTHKSAPEYKPFELRQIKRTYSAEVKPSYVKPAIKREIKFQPKKTANGGSGISVASKETAMESDKTQSTHKSKQTEMNHKSHKSAPEFKPFKLDRTKMTHSAEVKPSYVKPIKRKIEFQPKKTANPSSNSPILSVASKSSMKSAKTEKSAPPEFKPIKRTYSAEVKPSYAKPIKRGVGPGTLNRSMSADRKELIMGRLSSILPEDQVDDDLYAPKIRPKRRPVPIKTS
jgi:hypothetical protein